ncbi:RCC1 and BTB domain-containing protein 1 isoform X2 [Andrena cerasifolii]
MVTHDDMVYALGSNNEGCSGTGTTSSSLTPIKVIGLCKKNIKTFAHGSSSHVLALTYDGQVYSWGNNNKFQLGNNHNSTYPTVTPTHVLELLSTTVVDIACGKFHSVALTANGEVYQWGENKHGTPEYPNNIYMTNIPTPRKVESDLMGGKKIACISCGDSFSMAVTVDGQVYGWGDNSLGQLGIGNYDYQGKPCKIIELPGIAIKKVVCGYMHTLALSKQGILYTWGVNTYGQLGHSEDTTVCSPVQLNIPSIRRVLDVAATHYNNISVAMGDDNLVFIWGHCLGQCIAVPTLTPHRCLYDALACYATPNVMHKPFELCNTDTTNLTVRIGEAFDDANTSDLTIQVEEKPIHVHKAILKIRSQYFRTMFQEHWAENNQRVIKHDQFSYNVYRAFLKYLYTDQIDLPVEDADEFLNLTNAYCESKLRSCWIRLIKKDVTVNNVIFLYSIAMRYNAKELEVYCILYALKHMTVVVNTPYFSELDQLTMKSFIIKAANAGAFKT